MAKILVTGATGFIGNQVIPLLLAKGHNVIATARSEMKARDQNWFSSVKFLALDFSELNSEINYFQYFGFPDKLLHLAWEGLPNYLEDFHIEENLPRHKLFLQNLLINGLKDITVTGTCYEYGLQEGCLSETMNADPVTSYGIAKNELKKCLFTLGQENKINVKWLRLFYMFGKGQAANSLYTHMENAVEEKALEFKMSGGEQVRDFLPLSKMAKMIAAATVQNDINGIINCCSGVPVKVSDFVEDFFRQKNYSIKLQKGFYPYVSYEPMEFWGDNTKIKSII